MQPANGIMPMKYTFSQLTCLYQLSKVMGISVMWGLCGTFLGFVEGGAVLDATAGEAELAELMMARVNQDCWGEEKIRRVLSWWVSWRRSVCPFRWKKVGH